MFTSELTQEYANELFEYVDGKLYWKINKFKVKKGKEAGCIKAKGYKYVGIDNVQYRVHRVIFLMHHGYCPTIIDHIDNDKLNNKIDNLKEVSNSENLRKTPIRIRKNNNKTWRVFLTKHFGYKILGDYETLELANIAKNEFKIQYNIK